LRIDNSGWGVCVFSFYIQQKYYVTKSYYDQLPTEISITGLGGSVATRRNRIVAALYYNTLVAGSEYVADYDYGTFYDYDVTGNVRRLVQRLQESNTFAALQKTLDYEYDLVSGKVNRVLYQSGMADQYFYKYTYDLDNKLKAAESCADGVDFMYDAQYFYYVHGPLARKELGNSIVQGLDYAYTLQGWLKAINGGRIDRETDMGQDGYIGFAPTNGLNHLPSQVVDAFAMTLGYFNGDYTAIGGQSLDLLNAYEANDLFNGNIGHATYQMYTPTPMGNEVMR
jgi:hypothetical protein